MFYVYITWRLIVGFPSVNRTPTTIDSSLDMPRFTFMGIDISEQRTPQVKITNINGEALSGVNVTINLIKISTDSVKATSPIWDFDYRSKIEGSLDYIRFHEVCKVELSGNMDITDAKGNAYFKDFKITRGPEALYTFQYLIKVDDFTNVTSESFTTYVISQVFELESLNTLSLREPYTFGKPLKTQPRVKVKNSSGMPIKGKRVIAFSWVEPSFDTKFGFKNSPSNRKYLSLQNIISEPSDENGIASFNNLTITGTVELLAYIHFYCEGVVTVWTNRPIKKNLDDILPPRAINPALGDIPPTKIEILNDVERIVVEGSSFPENQYSLRVSNSSSLKPIPGIAWYAYQYLHSMLIHWFIIFNFAE